MKIFICFSLFLLFNYSLFAQASSPQKSEELKNIFNQGGEKALKDYISANKDITIKNAIKRIAQEGLINSDEKTLNISLSAAKDYESQDLLGFVFLRIALLNFNLTNFESALKYSDSAFFYSNAGMDAEGIGNAYKTKGNIFEAKEEFQKARAEYEKALIAFQSKNYYTGIGLSYRGLATSSYKSGAKTGVSALFDSAFYNLSFVKEKERDTNAIAGVYQSKGYYFQDENKKDSAIANIKSAIALYNKVKNASKYINLGKSFLALAEIFDSIDSASLFDENLEKAKEYLSSTINYFDLGKAYQIKAESEIRRGAFDNAIFQIDTAESYYSQINDIARLAEIERLRADAFIKMNRFEQAKKSIDKAIAKYALIKAPLGEAMAYKTKADLLFRENKFDDAKQALVQCESKYQSAGLSSGAAQIKLLQADIFIKESAYDKALSLLDSAFALFERQNDVLGKGDVYKSKAELFSRQGKSDFSIKALDSALAIYQSIQAKKPIARIVKSKGDIAYYEGKTDIAMKYYSEALELSKSLGDIGLLAAIYRSQGAIKIREGRNEDAKKIFSEASKLYEKAKEPIGQANVLISLADIYLKEKNSELAKTTYLKAAKIYESKNENNGIGNTNKGLGELYYQKKSYDSAKTCFQKALSSFERTGDPIGKGNVYKGLADVAFAQGDYAGASSAVDKALDFYQKINNAYNSSNAFVLKARILAKLKKTQEAIQSYNSSLAILEKMRRNIVENESKISFMKSMYARYEETAYYILTNGELEDAFKVIESMKARAFLDLIAEGRKELDKGIPQDLKTKRDSLEREVESFTKMKVELMLSKDADQKKINFVQSKIDETDSKAQDLKIKIKLNNAAYASVEYPEPIDYKSLKQKLGDNEIILEYLITDSASFCILADKSGIKSVKLPCEYASIMQEIETFNQAISDKNTSAIQRNKLYSFLIQPLEAFIANKKIILIPDAYLSVVPFEALYNADKKLYFLEAYNALYYPSSTVFSIFRSSRQSAVAPKLLCLADPVYDYENFIKGAKETGAIEQSREFYKMQGPLNRLNATNDEALEIEKIFKKKNYSATLLMRENAQEEKLKQAPLKDYSYIHFATHGIANNLFQALILGQIPNVLEDGFLTLEEILNLKLNCNLATLSACQTGLGKLEKGEGVSGLSRAFMTAGAKSVVASLWSVSDKATSKLMIEFYANLIEKEKSKIESLKNAKLLLLNDKEYSNPYYWAPFVLYGE